MLENPLTTDQCNLDPDIRAVSGGLLFSPGYISNDKIHPTLSCFKTKTCYCRERPVGPVVSPYDVPYQTSRGGPVFPQPRPAQHQQVSRQKLKYFHSKIEIFLLKVRKHRRKTFVFPFPFISLKFKKFAVELSEYQ